METAAPWSDVLRQALNAGDWLVAEGALRRLLLLGAAAAEQLDLLAYVLLMQGRYADAEATLEQALAAGSRSFWTPHKLGDARRGQQRLEAAAAAYEQALAWGSDSPLTVRNLLEVLVGLDPQRGLQRLQQLAAAQQPGWQSGACSAAGSGLAPELAEWLCAVGADDPPVRALVCIRRLCRLDLEGTRSLLRTIDTPWSAPLQQRLERLSPARPEDSGH
jgi:tetratricopeptide (TPR) repeat protein